MSRNIIMTLALFVLVASVVTGCKAGQNEGEAQSAQVQLPAAQPIQQLPAPVPVAAPQVQAAPPPTPLIPLAAEPGEAVASKGTGTGKVRPKVPGVDGVDVPLPGNKIQGDELIGNYGCVLDAEGLPLGPFKLPALGCRIYRADDGTLRLGPTTQNIAAIQGTIENPTDTGFFVVGGFKFPGNKLNIKARLQKKPGAETVYSGKGRGMLNEDKNMQKNYTLTLTKK